ncbi:hypothetical protein DSO57_1020989 [Entomophthora muscae]|uniref:Uncharacterized protein n=1 Tax=Entomophthora muscae TaxID=34485 RepID=A0ACC2UNP8_9FUNG|nr:hypothetical protein DSO57_1020989 [Entomophthora muscae]
MANPHEIQQEALLGRIASNVRKLNEVIEELNDKLNQLNATNEEISKFSNLWTAYHLNSMIHLDSRDILNTKSEL